MDSILTSIKKLLGIEESYKHFDPDIVMCINSAFTILTQLGVGPSGGFSITDENSKWSDYISDLSKIEAVKTYVHLRVRMLFDPPSNGTLVESINKSIQELEWRLNTIVETDVKEEFPEEGSTSFEEFKDDVVDAVIAALPNGDEVSY